jgi:hypothetical protein
MIPLRIVSSGSLIMLKYDIYNFCRGQYFIILENLEIRGNDGVNVIEIRQNSLIPVISNVWFRHSGKQYMLSNDFEVIQNGT